MQLELALILVVAGGLVAAAVVGAAVAVILGNRLSHRRLAGREYAQPGPPAGQAAVQAAGAPAVQRPQESAHVDAAAALELSATREGLDAASALPEAPWEEEAGMPPASPSVAGAEPVAFRLPEAPWDQEGGTPPPSSLPGPTAAQVASTLPEAAWGQEDSSSPPAPRDISTPSAADLSQNGAGRHGQRFGMENGATPPRGPDRSVGRGSDGSANDGAWGDLPTETEADDPTGWGLSGHEWPTKPDPS